MATVKITDTLVGAIRSKARGSFDPRLARAKEKIKSSGVLQRALTEVYAKWMPVLDQLPKELREINAVSNLEIGAIYDEDGVVIADIRVYTETNFPYSLTKETSFYDGQVIYPYGYGTWAIRKPSVASQLDIYNEFLQLAVEFRQIEQERNKLVGAVDKILAAHTTLNAAVKTWKPLLSFVPQEYIDRLERKAAPRAKKVECEAPDISDLNAATSIVIANKLGV